ncbi:MAG: restriction endonuclease [Coriobacteriia bacterium]|nr:restriction endonuclease [Coriobacteriia bacterium]
MRTADAIGWYAVIGAFALLAPWLSAFTAAVIARRRLRAAAAAGDPVGDPVATQDARVLGGSLPAGVVLGSALLALACAPTAWMPRAADTGLGEWWPLMVVAAVSCLSGGIATVALARGFLAGRGLSARERDAVNGIVAGRESARDARAEHRRDESRRMRAIRARRHADYRVERMYEMTGDEFEELCADYFEAIGYTVDFTPQSGDGGVDLILTRDGELIVVQCKQTRKPAGQPIVRDLFGAMHHAGADACVVCASNGFTPAAREWAEANSIGLLDGIEIVETLRRTPEPRRG